LSASHGLHPLRAEGGGRGRLEKVDFGSPAQGKESFTAHAASLLLFSRSSCMPRSKFSLSYMHTVFVVGLSFYHIDDGTLQLVGQSIWVDGVGFSSLYIRKLNMT
jgi:hypothetical protein